MAGAGRPRNGGGSACGSSVGGDSTVGAGGSTGRSIYTSRMTSTGRSTMTSLTTSTGTSLTTSCITIFSLGGWLLSSRTFFLGFQRLPSLPQVRVGVWYS